MSVSVPNGALVAIASGYSAAVPVTAVTNATPAVASAVNTFTAGDIVEITSGWSRITNKVVRVATPSGTAFSLEGIDTTLTSIYPVAGGAGTARKVSGWTQLSQILSSSTDGGTANYVTYQFLESDAEKRIPTFKSAFGLTFSVADDATQPGFILAAAANDDRLPRAIRITLPSGSVLLYSGYLSLNRTPSLTINELMACEVTVSLLAEPVRYTI
jgi:hypothetical protein